MKKRFGEAASKLAEGVEGGVNDDGSELAVRGCFGGRGESAKRAGDDGRRAREDEVTQLSKEISRRN